MKVKIKKIHPSAVIPTYSKKGDACVDLYCTSIDYERFAASQYDANIVYGTGISLEIPSGHVGLIFPRSSVSKKNVFLRNAVGVIDSGYRGEIILKYGYYNGTDKNTYKIGDRIGQLMILPFPVIEFEEVNNLTKTERGTGGFGSTGV